VYWGLTEGQSSAVKASYSADVILSGCSANNQHLIINLAVVLSGESNYSICIKPCQLAEMLAWHSTDL